MSPWIVAIVAACVAAGVAVPLRMTLSAARHRLPDEDTGPRRHFWWVLPALPSVVLLVTHALAERVSITVALMYAAACVPLIALVAIDSDVHRLPDRLTLPLAGGAAVIALIASATTGDWGAATRAFIAGAVLFAAGFLLLLASPNAMGFGDVKLLASLGVLTGWLGWSQVLSAILVAFIASGVWAALLLVSKRASRHTAIAFGPFLISGALVAFVGG